MVVETHRIVCIDCGRESDEMCSLRNAEWPFLPYGVRVGRNVREHSGVCPDCWDAVKEEPVSAITFNGLQLERPDDSLPTVEVIDDDKEDENDVDGDSDDTVKKDTGYESVLEAFKDRMEEQEGYQRMPRYTPTSMR